MSDEAFAAPTSSQTGAAVTPAGEGDYDAICAAVMETVRGRWFLNEYSRRNRHADTQLVLAALDRIERGLRGRQTPESVERLRDDLMEMARAIARAKAEITGASVADEGDPVGDVSQELDSVVRATEEATSNILAAAAQIQEVAWSMREQGNDAGLADQLSAYAATIQTAASSQKLVGERTQKVVDVMRDLEGRINDMIDVWGAYPAVDNRLLANSARNTPALPPADFVQAEIDAPTDVEPQQTSSNERDATAQDLPLTTAQETSRREPRHLNDNGRARSANGHLVLDPGIVAAIRDAASLTNTGAEGNPTSPAQVAEDKATGLAPQGTPPNEWSGDGKDAAPSKSLEPTVQPAMQELPDTQAQDGSRDVKTVTEVGSEKPQKSELGVAEQADPGGETIAPRRESAPSLEVLSGPIAQAGPAEVSANNAGPSTAALDVGTEAAPPPEETSPSEHAQAEVALSPSSGAPSAGGLAHPQAVGETAAEPDQQLEPLAEKQADTHETLDAQDVASVEIPPKPKPFVVIDLDLEPLIGFDTQAPPSPSALNMASADARGMSGSAREKEPPTAAEPKPAGWLSEPVTALYDLPPLEVVVPPPFGATSSVSAPEVPPARQAQSGSRWPFAFLAPRLRTKPTESAPSATTAPPPAVTAPPATKKMVSTPLTIAPAVAFELGGLVVVAPPVASEPRRSAVAAAPQSSEQSSAVVAAVATPVASKSGDAAVAAAAPPEALKPDAPAPVVPPATPVAPTPAPSAQVAAAAAPTVSEPSAPSVAAAVPPPVSEPVPIVAASAAASDSSGPVGAAGTSAKPAASSVKVLRPPPPPPSDPLAALAALSEEEKLALFS